MIMTKASIPVSKEPSKRFRMMTMNLRFGLADDGPHRWDCRKQSFGPLFDQRHPDIIAFQEANDFQIDFLRSLFPGYGIVGQRAPAPSFWQNNVLFYRTDWTCHIHRHPFLSPTPGIPSRSPESRWPRQCTMAQLASDGFRIICINTHLDFDTAVQVESAQLILRHLSSFPPDAPVILMGDFNAEPGSSVFNVFSGERQAGLPGAARTFKSSFAPPYPGTYHGFTGVPDGRHIDWVMYCGDLDVIAADVISDPFDGMYPSDHFPIQVDFRIVPG